MKTDILKITSSNRTALIKKAADALDEGDIVAFPTETVYGLGCRVEPSAIKRLDELKERPIEKHYTLHIGDQDQLNHYIPEMDVRCRKLVQNGLPGPMTIVFQLSESALNRLSSELSTQTFNLLYSDGTLGIRYPDNPVASAILSRTRFPVVAPSANPAGQIPAASAREVLEYFDGRIQCVVETPEYECDFKKSSTVVKIGCSDMTILRQGVISESQIRRWSTYRILFVCTGNTCRSPIAEGICRKYFSDKLGLGVDHLAGLGYKVSSAGIAAYPGMPASRQAVEVCRKQRIDLSSHRSSPLTSEDVEQSDVIFTMTHSHSENIVQMYPASSHKCFVLAETADIPDPIGMGYDVYHCCFQKIQESVMKRMDELI